MKLMTIAAACAALVGLASPTFGQETKEMAKEATSAMQEAPAFTLKDVSGKEHSLSDFAGKTVVLEWVNYGCPFVKKHYSANHMQELQETYTGKDVVWLAVASGKTAGTMSEEAVKEAGSKATAVLLDPTGETGKAYGAKTTPHMIVINKNGEIAYNGAIDDKPTPDSGDIEGAECYVSEALDAVLAGEKVETAKTKPYGCSVKY